MKIAIKIHSQYSIQKSPTHIDDLIKTAAKDCYDILGLSDYHSISGIPEFLQTIQKYNKKSEHKIKPIVGMSVNTDSCGIIYIYAKNKIGWYELVKLTSYIRCNNLETINIDNLVPYLSENLLLILNKEHEKLNNYQYIVNDEMASYYIETKDKLLQDILICSHNHLTLEEYKNTIGYSDVDLSLKPQNFNSKLFDDFEVFDISNGPKIPKFIDTNGVIENSDEFLTELCRSGWRHLQIKEKSKDENIESVYIQRINEELSIIKDAKLSNYFLLVHDFVNYCRKNNKSAGLRGSAVGSLIFYLIGVTTIDPVKPDPTLPYDPDKSLLFSRFINKARFANNKTSLPDADIDVHPSFRSSLKEYIKNKYSKDRVCDIVTFSKMKGSKTIKEVFRVLGLSFELANTITEDMIDEAGVQDEIEDIRETQPKYNIINYCIDNIPKIKGYYEDYKYEFDIAIQLTNTITNESKHAAGIVVADEPISNFIPITNDGENNIGLFKMQDIEYVGGVKMDILGVLAYEKLDNMIQLINQNKGK